MRVLVARAPLDFRTGIDGTVRVCRRILEEDPFGGKVFLFHNRARTMVRLLTYDGQGFWLLTKRLSVGRFRFWRTGDGREAEEIDPHQLSALLASQDWTRMPRAKCWKRVASGASMEA